MHLLIVLLAYKNGNVQGDQKEKEKKIPDAFAPSSTFLHSLANQIMPT